MTALDTQKAAVDNKKHQHVGVNERPPWNFAFFMGCQQASVCFSGLLVTPFVVSDLMCAGASTIDLRVKLISATFVASGIATLLQTTLGLRLSILNGPAFAFLPPLLAFFQQPGYSCTQEMRNQTIPDEVWMGKIATVSGSLMLASLVFVVVGMTGMVGVFSKLIGPLTVVPVLLLLTLSTIPTIHEKLAIHWVSMLMLLTLIIFVVYLNEISVPIPHCSRPIKFTHIRLFGQFPYLLAIILTYLVCVVLTMTGWEPVEGAARVDKALSLKAIRKAPWLSLPHPGVFGVPQVDIGLMLGFMASAISAIIENLGSYEMAARVSLQKKPPRSAVNRAIIVEGTGSILAGALGVCTGVTTYSENIALIHITRTYQQNLLMIEKKNVEVLKVASRLTMQIAGLLLVLGGLFTKVAAVLASIPDPLIGGILCMGMSIIAGVALSQLQLVDLNQLQLVDLNQLQLVDLNQLQLVDLKLSRNLSILGISVLLGMVIPTHFEMYPLSFGNDRLEKALNMLLSIKMLIGGSIAFLLDNTVIGASKRERGFLDGETGVEEGIKEDADGYAFPHLFNQFLHRRKFLNRLPFLPSRKNLDAIYPYPPNRV